MSDAIFITIWLLICTTALVVYCEWIDRDVKQPIENYQDFVRLKK